MSSILKPGVIRTLPLFALLALPVGVNGQSPTTVFFTGTSNASWNVGANWGTGTKPTTAQIAGINGNSGGTGAGGIILVDTDSAVGGIGFSGSVAKTISLNNGVTLTLHGTGTETTLINQSGNQNLTISGSGSLVLANSGVMLVSNSNRTLSITAKITETGGSRQIIKTGSGTLQLTNALAASSTYSGGLRIEEGSVTTNVSTTGVANAPTQGVFGTGTITFVTGTLNYSGNTAGTIHNSISIEGSATIGNSAMTQALTLAGNINLNGGTRTITAQQTLTASGNISNGSLTKSGTSQFSLTGSNSYTGTTHVQQGILNISGSGSIASSTLIQVDSGATLNVANSYALASGQRLTGSGTVTGTLRTGSGTIDPGSDGLGTLNVQGSGVFNGGAIRFELADAASDLIHFSGNSFSLTGNTTGAVRLTLVDFDGTAEAGSYLLISTSDLTGATFTNWNVSAFTLDTVPATWNGALRMSGNNLYYDLYAVPEPGTYVLLGGAAAAMWMLRGRRGKGRA